VQISAEKISLKEKIGYSLGDTASNLFFQTFILFLLYFYTDVVGLPAAAAGTLFLVTRIWDAINDPIMARSPIAPIRAGANSGPISFCSPCLSASWVS
jgi:Na+/melibiose symporter-like transporter